MHFLSVAICTLRHPLKAMHRRCVRGTWKERTWHAFITRTDAECGHVQAVQQSITVQELIQALEAFLANCSQKVSSAMSMIHGANSHAGTLETQTMVCVVEGI